MSLNFIDIKMSFKHGYNGGVINTQLVCPLVTDIVSWMDQMVAATARNATNMVSHVTATATAIATPPARIVLNFAHTETLMLLNTILGVNEDMANPSPR